MKSSDISRQSLPKNPPMSVGLFVWAFGAIFYLLGFFHRVAPAVITGELMQDFNISAAALGNLSAFYFYSYVAMQIPTGILADRWGPRRLLTMGSLIAAAGAVLFGLAPNIFWAATGRLLIGGSVAVAFVCLLKIAANWFAPSRFALISGLALFCGIVGAVAAGAPLRIMVDLYGWRHVMLLSAAVTILAAIGTWMFVRDNPDEKGFRNFGTSPKKDLSRNKTSIIDDIRHVFTYRNTLLLFVIPGGIVGTVLTFSGLWGVPYLTTMHGISPTEAASLTSALLVAWAMGGPFFGWLSDRVKKRKNIYVVGCGISLLGWIIIIFMQSISVTYLIPVLLVTGFSSGVMIISFAFAKESVPIRLAGTVSGVINMGVMLGPMILQPAVGWVLDRLWSGHISMSVRIYDTAAYRSGFSLMLIWLTLSLILLFFTKETHCRQLEG